MGSPEIVYLRVNANHVMSFIVCLSWSRFTTHGPQAQASRRYVRSRQKKYRHSVRVLFHLSIAPRKVLAPRRTTFQLSKDDERQHSLLFLSPLNELENWTEWLLQKVPRSRRGDVLDAETGGKPIVFYIHIVRVDPADLIVPSVRNHGEFAISRAVRPAAIVPVRFQQGRLLNLSRVVARAEQVKLLSPLGRSRRNV